MYRKWKGVSALIMAVLIGGFMPMSTLMAAEENPEVENTQIPASIAAPVIAIKWQGQDWSYGPGGKIDYKYDNNSVQSFECSASQAALIYYCLEKVGTAAEAKGEEQMDSLPWTEASSSMVELSSLDEGCYILYVKAEGTDKQISYARTGGIVIDTTAPEVAPLQEGGTYPEGEAFWVRDDYLESVTVNGAVVTPESDGSYRVSANGTTCVIWAKDRAGNEMTCSITVSGEKLAENSIISKNGIYPLKKGVAYQLAAGKWQVGGDRTIYQGGTFYVKEDGDYTFTKR